MDLTIYDIIKGPVLSEQAYRLNKFFDKLVLRVHPAANKPLIKEALEKLFNIKVDAVRIVVRKGKARRSGRMKRVVHSPLQKKAIVTLKEGYTLDLFDQAGMAKAEKKEAAPEVETKEAAK